MNQRPMTVRTLLMLLLVLATVSTAQEPEKKEAAKKEVDLQNVQTPKGDAALPKIDLPEFVITGNETIDLDLRSKAEEDEERIFTPARPTPGERALSAGEALTPKQVKQFTKVPGAMNGRVFAGIGFYGTPQFDGWFGEHDLKSSFVVNGYYSESAGHLPDAGFWRGGFGARGSYTLPDSTPVVPAAQLTGELEYGREAYRAYGSRVPGQVRDLSGLTIGAGIGSRYALPYKSMSGVDYSARLGWRTFGAADSQRSSESEFFLLGSATTKVLETAFRGGVEYRGTGYTMLLPGSQASHWFVLRGEGRQLLLPTLQVSYAVQQYLYRGNTGPAAGRFYPTVDVRFALTEQASLSAGFTPGVERNTLQSLFRTNPYIRGSAAVLPTDNRVHLYMGMEFSPMDELVLTARGSYSVRHQYATFYDRDSAKVWEVLYLSGVRATKFDLQALYRLNTKQDVTVYLSTQSVQQRDSSHSMPHVPAFNVGAVYHQYFDIGVHAEAFAEYHSSRYTDFANTHRNAGYVASGVKATAELFGQFRGIAEINNLFDQRYYRWDGYRERTIYLLLGISYQW
ncbi:MAG: TonB-dependent receptor [Bacteroidetes bacterium]|nr:TonB-dependent receptor [Bacteroidota bacterium]